MDCLETTLRLLYYISAPTLAIIAWYGLKQIKVHKENARLVAKRESYRIAAEQCRIFGDYLLPKINKNHKQIQDNKFSLFTKSKIEIKDGEFIAHKIVLKDPDKYTDIENEMIDEALNIANCMESMAIFFIEGIASEEVAFNSIGKSYCSEVERLLPIIMVFKPDMFYIKLTKLFKIWYNRLEVLKLKTDKNGIDKRLKDINGNIIKPLGI